MTIINAKSFITKFSPFHLTQNANFVAHQGIKRKERKFLTQ